jgi:hypothetical protein
MIWITKDQETWPGIGQAIYFVILTADYIGEDEKPVSGYSHVVKVVERAGLPMYVELATGTILYEGDEWKQIDGQAYEAKLDAEIQVQIRKLARLQEEMDSWRKLS